MRHRRQGIQGSCWPVTHTLTWVVRPTVLYGVKYIDLVSLGALVPRYFLLEAATHYTACTAPLCHTLTLVVRPTVLFCVALNILTWYPLVPVAHTMTWIMPLYALYGVKYIDLVSLAPFSGLSPNAKLKKAKRSASDPHHDLDYAPLCFVWC